MKTNKIIKIIYTSDIHGQISAFDFIRQKPNIPSLSRFSNYLKTVKDSYILIDNGDVLQGSPMLEYAREQHLENPVSTAMNALNYNYFTLGNHDFNYGKDVLDEYIQSNNAQLLCCNITDIQNNPLYKPYEIKEIDGIRLGFIGALTQYIPHWEKPENIKGMQFISAKDAIKKYVDEIKNQVDAIIVFYHGGYERDLQTGKPIGLNNGENEGSSIFEIPEIDCLLTGHQHHASVFINKMKATIQTSSHASNFGEITMFFHKKTRKLEKIAPVLVNNTFAIDNSFEQKFDDLVFEVNKSLDDIIATINCNMHIDDSFEARKNNHLFFSFINMIQQKVTGTNISAATLPNDAIGLSKNVTKREVSSNFGYVHKLVVLEITGSILKSALEKNAEYFSIDHGEIVVNPSYVEPKLQHYNFDIYDGINYTYKISNPMGQRLVDVTYNNEPIDDDKTYTICLNSYRANGGGDYFMFTEGKVIEEFEISYVEMMIEYIKNHPQLKMVPKNQFKVIV